MPGYRPEDLAQGVFRDGDRLVVPRAASALPLICVKCGQQMNVSQVKRKFGWHPPWVYILILPGLLIYAIVATIIMKRVALQVPLCEEHRAARKKKLILATAMLLGFIPFGIAVTVLAEDYAGWGWLVAFVIFIAGFVILSMSLAIIKPAYIDDNYSVFKGVCASYLDRLTQRNAVS